MARRLRGWLLRLVLACASAALGLIAVEAAARAAELSIPARGPAQRLKLVQPVPEHQSPGQGFALVPGAEDSALYPAVGDAPPNTVTYRVNSLGFRGEEVAREKPDGVFRIAVVGDSFTFGTGVNLEGTYPWLLQRELESRYPDRAVEVLNWGVYAYNTRQQVALLRNWLDKADPDLVLLVAYINDASGEDRGREAGKRKHLEARIIDALGLTSGIWDAEEAMPAAIARTQALRRTSVVADVLCHRLYRALRTRLVGRSYLDGWSEGSSGRAMFESALAEAADLCERHGTELRVGFYPDLHQLNDDYPFAPVHALVAELSAELGLVYYDLFEPLRGLDGRSLHAHAHDHHPSPRCNRIVAEWLAEQLTLE